MRRALARRPKRGIPVWRRPARQPTAADIAAMPFEGPDEAPYVPVIPPKAKRKSRAKPQAQGDRPGVNDGEFCNRDGCCGRMSVVESLFVACNACGNLFERNPT